MQKKNATHLVGEGSLRELENLVGQHAAEKILFVVDSAAYAACGASSLMEGTFKSRTVERFDGFEVNPKIEDVERGVDLARRFQPDIIVALGGGTAIDLAKLVGVFSRHSTSTIDAIAGRVPIEQPGPPLIAIPTTSGSGSEATHFAVVYLDGIKYSIAHPALQPDHAIIDPALTHSLPARMTAASGLDSFCQAIESIWAVASTEQSVAYAMEAATLSLKYLPSAVHHPTAEARAGMSKAAYLAGRAINIGKTTAPHALSYYLTSRHNVPHGMAVAVTLGPMLRFNAEVTDSDCSDPRGILHVRGRIENILRILDAPTVEAADDRINQLILEVGCPTSLIEAGVNSEEELQRFVQEVNTERLSNNPRKATPDQLVELFQSVNSFQTPAPHFNKLASEEGVAKHE